MTARKGAWSRGSLAGSRHVFRAFERDHSPGRIFCAAERTIKPKRDRCVGEQFEFRTRQPDFAAFFRASRNKTDGLNGGGCVILQADVISPRQTSAHKNTAAGRAHIGVISST